MLIAELASAATETCGVLSAPAASSDKLAHCPRRNSAKILQSFSMQPESALVRATALLGKSLSICHLCVDTENATAPNGAPSSSTGLGVDNADKGARPEHPSNSGNAAMQMIRAGSLEIPPYS